MLEENEQMKVEDLIKGIAIASENELVVSKKTVVHYKESDDFR